MTSHWVTYDANKGPFYVPKTASSIYYDAPCTLLWSIFRAILRVTLLKWSSGLYWTSDKWGHMIDALQCDIACAVRCQMLNSRLMNGLYHAVMKGLSCYTHTCGILAVFEKRVFNHIWLAFYLSDADMSTGCNANQPICATLIISQSNFVNTPVLS